VWPCEAASGKPTGNNPAKSKEAERGALVGRGGGLAENEITVGPA